MHIGTNHLGHFALTGMLLEKLQATPGSRVVNTSSMAHRLTKGLKLDDLHLRAPSLQGNGRAYGQSKLASLLYTFELDRRPAPGWPQHRRDRRPPGLVQYQSGPGTALMRWANSFMAQPAATWARCASLYAATAADVQGGDYLGPGGFKELRGYPAKVGSSEEARNSELAAGLWQRSEQLTGTKYL